MNDLSPTKHSIIFAIRVLLYILVLIFMLAFIAGKQYISVAIMSLNVGLIFYEYEEPSFKKNLLKTILGFAIFFTAIFFVNP